MSVEYVELGCHGTWVRVPLVGVSFPCRVCGSVFEFESE